MAKYRKKPVVVEAFRLGHDESPDWMEEAVEAGDADPFDDGEIGLLTRIGKTLVTVSVAPGDWVIRGVAGELYPCKHDIFIQSYEPAA